MLRTNISFGASRMPSPGAAVSIRRKKPLKTGQRNCGKRRVAPRMTAAPAPEKTNLKPAQSIANLCANITKREGACALFDSACCPWPCHHLATGFFSSRGAAVDGAARRRWDTEDVAGAASWRTSSPRDSDSVISSEPASRLGTLTNVRNYKLTDQHATVLCRAGQLAGGSD